MQHIRWKQLKHANTQAKLEVKLGKGAKFDLVADLVADSVAELVADPLADAAAKSVVDSVDAVADSVVDSVDVVKDSVGDSMADLVADLLANVVTDTVADSLADLIANLVVIDKCHTILQSGPDFRPKMREAGAILGGRGKQMIFLTATLAPASEPEFFDIMWIDPVRPIRGVTTRPNIRYSVVEYERGIEQSEAVSRLISQKLQEYPSPAKMIIYSNSIRTIEELGDQLGYPMYYADVGSEKEKAQIQQRWENATERVAICSNALCALAALSKACGGRTGATHAAKDELGLHPHRSDDEGFSERDARSSDSDELQHNSDLAVQDG